MILEAALLNTSISLQLRRLVDVQQDVKDVRSMFLKVRLLRPPGHTPGHLVMIDLPGLMPTMIVQT